ncbi:MAG: IS110 family transposase, partial [Caldiserica bacterium]|nr:IS110 family transposase [Caldisericota bacterium]
MKCRPRFIFYPGSVCRDGAAPEGVWPCAVDETPWTTQTLIKEENMSDPRIRVSVDVGCKTHRVGIASSEGKILEEFTIPHSQEGFQKFFDHIEGYRKGANLSV